MGKNLRDHINHKWISHDHCFFSNSRLVIVSLLHLSLYRLYTCAILIVLFIATYLLLLIMLFFSDLILCIFVQLLQKFLKENGDKFKRSYKSDQKIYAVSSHWLKLQLSETKKVLKFAKKKTQQDSLHIFKSNCNKLKLIDATSIAWLLSD